MVLSKPNSTTDFFPMSDLRSTDEFLHLRVSLERR